MGASASHRRAPVLPTHPLDLVALFGPPLRPRTWHEIASVDTPRFSTTFVFALSPDKTRVSITKRNTQLSKLVGEPAVIQAVVQPSLYSRAIVVNNSLWYILYISPDSTVIAIGTHSRSHAWILTTNSLCLYSRPIVQRAMDQLQAEGYPRLIFRQQQHNQAPHQ